MRAEQRLTLLRMAERAVRRSGARRLLREAHDIMAVCIDICAKLRALTGAGERRA